MLRGVSAGAAGIGLGRSATTCGSTTAGPQAMPSASAIRGGIGRARAGRHPGHWQRGPSAALATGDPHRADRVRASIDPVGAGFVESLARPGGNATGFITFRIRHEREMAGAAQGDRAGRDARGGASGSSVDRGDRPVRARSRPWRRRSESSCAPSTCATPARSSAPSRLSRALPNGGLIVTAGPIGDCSSRSDHRARGPAQAARGLPIALFRRTAAA